MRQFMLTVFKWTTWNVECVNVRFLLKHWKFLFPTKFSHIWSFQSILHHIVRTLRKIGWFIRNLFLLSLQTKTQKTFWLTPILLQLSGVMSFILWFWKKSFTSEAFRYYLPLNVVIIVVRLRQWKMLNMLISPLIRSLMRKCLWGSNWSIRQHQTSNVNEREWEQSMSWVRIYMLK